MAYYEKRGNAWRAQIRRKGHPTLSATFDTKAECPALGCRDRGGHFALAVRRQREAQRTTLDEALKRYQRAR